jgi:hypothetical protein
LAAAGGKPGRNSGAKSKLMNGISIAAGFCPQ